MALSEQEKRSDEFQRGLGKSTAEIEDTRRFVESGEQPSDETRARYQSREEADAAWKRSAQEKRSEAYQRGLGKSTAEIETTRKANREAEHRMLDSTRTKVASKSGQAMSNSVKAGDENNYATQLTQIRSLEGVYKEINELKNQGQAFGHPSYFKYFICGSLALLKDGLDILALLNIAVLPMWWFIGPFLSLIVLIIFWLFNIKQKRAKEYMKTLEQNIEIITTNIAHAVRVASMVPGVKKKVVKVGITKIASFASKNPTIKIAAATGAEAIPLFSLVPWNTIGVILAYLDEKKIYKNAAENGQEASEQLSSYLGGATGSLQ